MRKPMKPDFEKLFEKLIQKQLNPFVIRNDVRIYVVIEKENSLNMLFGI